LGSIPFGILVSKVFGLGNLRDIGSGNIGATNVLRTGNKLAALITLILDGLKGVLVVVVARFISEDAAITASIFVIIGHIYPVWLRFSGGKGVATFIGAILALSFVTGLLVCFIWIIIALVFRYSSLSAIVSSASAPIGIFLFYDNEALVVTLFMTVLIWYRHKDNIRRLIDGSEAKIGKI
jgi:glycerol-3-phosphate acyltransferase PlsY